MTEEKKNTLIFFTILAVIYLAYAGIFSYLSPVGFWRNQILGTLIHKESDPTGMYVANAITFWHRPSSYYMGHPGTPMEALIYVVVQIYYLGSLLIGFKGSYSEFCASNINHIFFLAKVTMAFTHLISFYVLFRFSQRLLKNTEASLLAVLGYATSLPVLYYLTRASVEPLIVIFLLGSFLAYWNYEEQSAVNNRRGKYVSLMIIAFFAVAGGFAKLHLLAPLPFYMLGLIFVIEMRRRSGKKMLLDLSVFSGFAGLFTALWSLRVDWHRFYDYWLHYTPANYHKKEVVSGTSIMQIKSFLLSIAGYVSSFFKSYFSYSREGVYTISECLFFIIASIGLYLYLRNNQSRRRLIAPFIYLMLMSPIILFRVEWHYLFPYQAIAAIFFGLAVFSFVEHIVSKKLVAFRFVLAGLIVIMIHSFAIYAIADSRIHDAAVYQRNIKPYYDALNKQGYKGQVFVLYQGAVPVGRYHIYGPYSSYYSADMALFPEFQNVFKFIQVKQNYDNLYSLIKSRFPEASIIYEPANIDQVVAGVLMQKVIKNNEIKSPKGPF